MRYIGKDRLEIDPCDPLGRKKVVRNRVYDMFQRTFSISYYSTLEVANQVAEEKNKTWRVSIPSIPNIRTVLFPPKKKNKKVAA